MVWPYAMIVNLNKSNSGSKYGLVDIYTYPKATRNYYEHAFFARAVAELNRLLEEKALGLVCGPKYPALNVRPVW